QVGKGSCRCRICQVICRYVNRLYRCNRTIFGRSNTFLHRTHLCCKSWLVTYRRRHTSKKCRYLRTSLGKTEDIIYEEKNVFSLSFTCTIPKILSNGKT